MAEEEYTVRTTRAWMKQEHPLKFEAPSNRCTILYREGVPGERLAKGRSSKGQKIDAEAPSSYRFCAPCLGQQAHHVRRPATASR